MKRFRDPSSLSSTGLGVSARIPLDDKGSADDDDDWKVLNVGAWWYSLDVEVVLESLSTILDLWGNHHGHVWFFCRVWHVVFSHVTSFHVFFQILQLWCRVTCEVDVVSSWQVPDKQVLEPTLFHRHTVNRVSAPRSTVVSSERWSVRINRPPSTNRANAVYLHPSRVHSRSCSRTLSVVLRCEGALDRQNQHHTPEDQRCHGPDCCISRRC